MYERYLTAPFKSLRRKGKSRGKKEARDKFNLGKSIRKRDRAVYKIEEFGYWEAGTVVSGRGKTKACFATLAERKTRYYIASKMPNKSTAEFEKKVILALKYLPDDEVKTITCNQGTEFANWQTIEKELNCQMYFADSYCAWQKDTNENLNGLLREFYPKVKNLSRVSTALLKKSLALINARFKKVLNYQKLVDLFEFFVSKYCT